MQDIYDNELRPIMEQTVANRDKTQLRQLWQQMYTQLLDYKAWETSSSSSLYGTGATPSLQVGQRQKKFAQVRVVAAVQLSLFLLVRLSMSKTCRICIDRA